MSCCDTKHLRRHRLRVKKLSKKLPSRDALYCAFYDSLSLLATLQFHVLRAFGCTALRCFDDSTSWSTLAPIRWIDLLNKSVIVVVVNWQCQIVPIISSNYLNQFQLKNDNINPVEMFQMECYYLNTYKVSN